MGSGSRVLLGLGLGLRLGLEGEAIPPRARETRETSWEKARV